MDPARLRNEFAPRRKEPHLRTMSARAVQKPCSSLFLARLGASLKPSFFLSPFPLFGLPAPAFDSVSPLVGESGLATLCSSSYALW